MKKAQRGRPSLCTPELIKRICANLEKPMPFKYAIAREGINESTAYDWLKRGEAGEEPYATFFQAVTRAKAEAVARLIDHSLAGGRGSMNALWHLERRFRDEYGDIKRIEHAGHDGGAIQIAAKAVTEMSDEELLRIADAGTSTSGVGPKGTLPP